MDIKRVTYFIIILLVTTILGCTNNKIRQNETIARSFAEAWSSHEVLTQATSLNGELMALSGKLNPYPNGPLGVIKEGAYADILLVDGNPVDDARLLENYAENIDLIMKDGKVYKNTL